MEYVCVMLFNWIHFRTMVNECRGNHVEREISHVELRMLCKINAAPTHSQYECSQRCGTNVTDLVEFQIDFSCYFLSIIDWNDVILLILCVCFILLNNLHNDSISIDDIGLFFWWINWISKHIILTIFKRCSK